MTHMETRKNRRQFLEESLLAAAVMAAAGPGDLLADEGTAHCSPLDQLGVAVIGVRGRGNTHLGFFAGRRDTRLLYLCDVDRHVGLSRVEQVVKRQGGNAPVLVDDMRRVFDDPRVDVVSIATPHHWHALAAIWAMQAGKDVYVEKPTSHNVREGRGLVQAARRHQRICQSGMQTRSNPAAMEAVQFVRGGGIGRAYCARAICYKPRASLGTRGFYPLPRHINYDLWLGPAAAAPLTRSHFHHDWHWQWPYGNGELGHQAFLPLDLCRWGLGQATISRGVWSWGGRFARGDSPERTTAQVAVYDYGDQSIVVETRGLPSRPYRDVQVGVIFEGSEGCVVMSSHDHGVAYDTTGRVLQQFHGGGGSAWHFRNFLRAVRRRSCRELNADIEEGHVTSSLVHLANLSYRLGCRVPLAGAPTQFPDSSGGDTLRDVLDRLRLHLRENGVDPRRAALQWGVPLTCNPGTEMIVNHIAANELLTREYRAPFVMPAAGSV